MFHCLQFPRSGATSHSQTQIESHLKLALRGLEATQHQVQELVAVVKDQSQQIERQSRQMEQQSGQIERQSQQIERLMSKDKEQSEKMERLMSSVQDQPPQRERRGPINQTFPTPFEWKISNIKRNATLRGATKSLVSEPFYLFRVGHKYSLKIEIAGSEDVDVYSLIVYIKVVPGEFDESLSWPCKEKVYVTVVIQSPLPAERENISQVIDFEKKPCCRPLHDDFNECRPILARLFDWRSYTKNYNILIKVN